MHAELLVDVFEVRLHRQRTDDEDVGDCACRAAVGRDLEDLALATGQPDGFQGRRTRPLKLRHDLARNDEMGARSEVADGAELDQAAGPVAAKRFVGPLEGPIPAELVPQSIERLSPLGRRERVDTGREYLLTRRPEKFGRRLIDQPVAPAVIDQRGRVKGPAPQHRDAFGEAADASIEDAGAGQLVRGHWSPTEWDNVRRRRRRRTQRGYGVVSGAGHES